MGNIIVSWSPVTGQSASTSNTIAVASTMALHQSYKSLLTHTQRSTSVLDELYGKGDSDVFQDSGLTALERLVKSNLLKPDAIADYTETVYKDRLDFLSGSQRGDSEESSEMIIKTILRQAKEKYEFVWIDAQSGTDHPLTNDILNQADLILVNLPQNRFALERFFNKTDFPEAFQEKPYFILISPYDKNAGFSLRNIKRQFKVKEPIFAIPYNTNFRDAINQDTVLDFFYRTMRVNKKDGAYPFVDALSQVNQAILKRLEYTTRAEDDWA